MTRCTYCRKPSIANIDGDNLCIDHGRVWLRGEQAAALADEPLPELAA